MYGLWRGARWARPVVYVTRGFDVLSGLLGLADRPSVALDVIGVVTIVLSLAAIVLLIRAPVAELTPRHGMAEARLERALPTPAFQTTILSTPKRGAS